MANTVVSKCLYNLWEKHWGKPLQLSQITWQDSQFDFFEPGEDLSQVFTVRLEERILVREEYRLAYEYFEANSNYKAAVGRSGRFILTGHPGIGKTCFLAYVLLRRLGEQKPTAVQLNSQAYVLFAMYFPTVYDKDLVVFCSSGSNASWSALPQYRDPNGLNDQGVWALSDAVLSEGEYVPCKGFLKSAALVVQAVSPASDRWDQWKKEQRAKLYVMSLWTEPELGALLTALELDVDRGLDFARQYGPCPRTVILTSDPDEERYHSELLEEAIATFARSPTQHLTELRKLRFPNEDSASSLFFVQPTAPGKRGTAEICIPTASLLTLLAKHSVQCMLNMHEVLTALARVPATRAGAQWILECYMHVWLSTPGRHALVTIADPSGRLLYLHGTTGGSHIPPCDKTIVGDFEAPERFEVLYWCPAQGQLHGVDAVIYMKSQQRAWLFQATVDESLRRTDEGLAAVCETLGQHGHVIQRKELVITRQWAGDKETWSTQTELLKDSHHGFDNILVVCIPVTPQRQLAVKLMEECVASAPDFAILWQTGSSTEKPDEET